MEITLDAPDQYLADYDPDETARRIKLYASVLMFRSEELSVGAAAELAGVNRFTFAAECQKHGIPLVNHPVDDLRKELKRCGHADCRGHLCARGPRGLRGAGRDLPG